MPVALVGSLDPAELKGSLLLEVIESGLDEARQLLLANIAETYLELSGDDRARYLALVSKKARPVEPECIGAMSPER